MAEMEPWKPNRQPLLADGVCVLTRTMRRGRRAGGGTGAPCPGSHPQRRPAGVRDRPAEPRRRPKDGRGAGHAPRADHHALSRRDGAHPRRRPRRGGRRPTPHDAARRGGREAGPSPGGDCRPGAPRPRPSPSSRPEGAIPIIRTRVLSLFEQHTEVIRKGKAAKPTEFGKVVQLQGRYRGLPGMERWVGLRALPSGALHG
jgi:hypothetical protein